MLTLMLHARHAAAEAAALRLPLRCRCDSRCFSLRARSADVDDARRAPDTPLLMLTSRFSFRRVTSFSLLRVTLRRRGYHALLMPCRHYYMSPPDMPARLRHCCSPLPPYVMLTPRHDAPRFDAAAAERWRKYDERRGYGMLRLCAMLCH